MDRTGKERLDWTGVDWIGTERRGAERLERL